MEIYISFITKVKSKLVRGEIRDPCKKEGAQSAKSAPTVGNLDKPDDCEIKRERKQNFFLC